MAYKGTKMYRERIMKYLVDGPATAHEIHDYLADNWRWSPNMNSLNNILSKDKRFKKVGQTNRKSYKIFIWGLATESVGENVYF